jgi:hypothetical protein
MTRRNVWMLSLAPLALAVAFAVGDSIGQRTMLKVASIQLNDVQAILAFNRLHDEREVQSLLDRACVTQAKEYLDFYRDEGLKLLAGFFRGPLSDSTKEYVSLRDPHLLKNLATYRSKYGDTWAAPDCNP